MKLNMSFDPLEVVTKPASSQSDALLTTPQLRARLGGISEMTIWRYERDTEINFPKPIRIKRRKYWRVREVEAFEAWAAREHVTPFNATKATRSVKQRK
jgi:predicted DNA-binding transcriptional regulator AlpA